MNAYCPECETELDQATGICPACRWNPTAIALAAQPQHQEPELSLTERYRGTEYDFTLEQAAIDEAVMSASSGFSRGRAFVLVALVLGIALYGVVIAAMGVL